MTKSIISNAYRIHSNMLRSSGVWPNNNPTLYYRTKTILTWFFSIGLCVTMWMETLNDLRDFTKLSEILYIMVTITAYILKLAIFTYRKKEFLGILDSLKDPLFVSYPDDLDHYMATTIKYSTFLANTYRYLIACCVCLYTIYPILDNKQLPFPFPYDVGKYRHLMYAFQLIAESYAAWNNSCLDTLCASLMGIGAAQLDILREKIIRAGEEDDANDLEITNEKDERVIVKIRECVQHHLAIIKFIEGIDHLFRIGILAQFVTSALVICNTLFHFLLISVSFQFFLLGNYFVVILAQVFMYCWYGNEIIYKSESIRDACYTFNWKSYGVKVRKYIFIMMERSKRPLEVTVYKFTSLSLVSFVAVLRWSYSCLALLMNMLEKRSTT